MAPTIARLSAVIAAIGAYLCVDLATNLATSATSPIIVGYALVAAAAVFAAAIWTAARPPHYW